MNSGKAVTGGDWCVGEILRRWTGRGGEVGAKWSRFGDAMAILRTFTNEFKVDTAEGITTLSMKRDGEVWRAVFPAKA